MVQTIKQALRKCLLDGGGKDWGELLPYMAMGHRMSMHATVGYTPYSLMFGRDRIFKSKLHHLEEGLDPIAASTQVQVFLDYRGQAFREFMPLAMRNLDIA